MPRLSLCLAALLALSLTACSHSATLLLKDGNRVDGKILGGTRTSILVRDDDFGDAAPPRAVPRDEVQRISHPGTLATILGGLGVAAGLVVMSVGIHGEAGCEGDFCGFGHLLLTVPGAGVAGLSLIPMIWGIATWGGSASAASTESGPSAGWDGAVIRF